MATWTLQRPGTSSRASCRVGRPLPRRRRPLALVVDDCDCVRVVIKVVLGEMAGVRVIGAETSEEALDLARRHKFDVVTSDLNRPGMNGLEFLRRFKQAHPTTPVLIISAALHEAVIRRARWFRAFGCLSKPFMCCELVELVQRAIASKKVCRTVRRARRSSRFTGP